MEVPGHLVLFLLATIAMYGLLADTESRGLRRFSLALPIIGAFWFGVGGILTTLVGYSAGTQLFLGIRLYLTWQRKDRDHNDPR